jgi:hypothetical protein
VRLVIKTSRNDYVRLSFEEIHKVRSHLTGGAAPAPLAICCCTEGTPPHRRRLLS